MVLLKPISKKGEYMCYVINLDEFNTYKDNIDFVCEEECNE